MKRRYALLLALPLLFITACSFAGGGKGAAESAVTEAALSGRRYVLSSVNGRSFTLERRTPELAFDENMRIFGKNCNRFTGQAELKNGVLKAPQLVSTRMLCPEDTLNQLEKDFFTLLREGAIVRLEGTTLVLRAGDTLLEYTESP